MAQAVRRDASAAPWRSITVVLLDDDAIRDVKYDHFGHREVTDVVAVGYNPIPGETGGRHGEIMVNVEPALREGRRRQRGTSRATAHDDELALYIAHGCDHLCGGRDDTPRDRHAMRRRERRWLRAATATLTSPPLLQPATGTAGASP